MSYIFGDRAVMGLSGYLSGARHLQRGVRLIVESEPSLIGRFEDYGGFPAKP